MQSTKPETRLIPLTQWEKFYPWPNVNGLRRLAFNRDENGFGPAFVKIGRKLLVDEARFFEIAREIGAGK